MTSQTQLSDIVLIKKLGSGTFSQVYLAHKKESKEAFAIKIFRKRYNSVEDVICEAIILEACRSSKHIVNMLAYQVKKRGYIMFEPLGSSLESVITNRHNSGTNIPLTQIKSICRQILQGLAYLKKKNIIHCDLKPDNIMFTDDTFESIKLIDMGNSVSEPEFDINSHYMQTKNYSPPEALIYTPSCGVESDMWAFGCIVYEMLTGDVLFRPKRINNMGANSQHLLTMVKILGPPSADFLSQGKRSKRYFDTSFGKAGHKFLYLLKSYKSLGYMIYDTGLYSKKEAADIQEFLAPIFVYDPKNRISPTDCLKSVWLS